VKRCYKIAPSLFNSRNSGKVRGNKGCKRTLDGAPYISFSEP
jgi:hypothetical protein